MLFPDPLWPTRKVVSPAEKKNVALLSTFCFGFEGYANEILAGISSCSWMAREILHQSFRYRQGRQGVSDHHPHHS